MKDIMVAYIIATLFALFMAGLGICIHASTVARIAAEQRDFDNYVFQMPDGQPFKPIDGFTVEEF